MVFFLPILKNNSHSKLLFSFYASTPASQLPECLNLGFFTVHWPLSFILTFLELNKKCCFASRLCNFCFPSTWQVNLKHGIWGPETRTGTETDTCTACAGTIILEFAALSRFTGDPVFEVHSCIRVEPPNILITLVFILICKCVSKLTSMVVVF